MNTAPCQLTTFKLFSFDKAMEMHAEITTTENVETALNEKCNNDFVILPFYMDDNREVVYDIKPINVLSSPSGYLKASRDTLFKKYNSRELNDKIVNDLIIELNNIAKFYNENEEFLNY